MSNEINELNRAVGSLEGRMTAQENHATTQSGAIVALTQDIAGVKKDTVKLAENVSDVKADTVKLAENVSEVKKDTAELKSDNTELKKDVLEVKMFIAKLTVIAAIATTFGGPILTYIIGKFF